jgi:HEAT repeat protein
VARGSDALATRAIDALRRIEGVEVDGSLNEFLATAEPRKRSAAIDAVGQRDVGPFLERLVAILEHDPDEQIRSSAAQVLGRSVRRHPQLAQVLSQVAKTDSSKSVRKHASRFLEQANVTGSSNSDLVGG